MALLCAVAAAAQEAPRHHRDFDGRMLTDPDLDAALVIDAPSGAVFFARNADAPRHPASLTKLMTLYLLFERLRQHSLALDSELAISAKAAAQPRSHLRLRAGRSISVDMAIKAIVVGSANDAAVAVAEALGGSESRFCALMTAKARQLGMAHSFFHNATGLPDPLQQSTAADLALLARRLIYDFPEYFGYFRLTQMTWQGVDVNTHNGLLGNYAGADGMKTGYVDASGYNLVSTAQRGDTRLIAVVLGGLTAEKRDEAAIALLDATFDGIKAHPPAFAATRAAKRWTSIVPVTAVQPSPAARIAGAMAAALLLAPGSPLVWALTLTAAEANLG